MENRYKIKLILFVAIFVIQGLQCKMGNITGPEELPQINIEITRWKNDPNFGEWIVRVHYCIENIGKVEIDSFEICFGIDDKHYYDKGEKIETDAMINESIWFDYGFPATEIFIDNYKFFYKDSQYIEWRRNHKKLGKGKGGNDG